VVLERKFGSPLITNDGVTIVIPKEFRTEDGKRIKFDVILYKGY